MNISYLRDSIKTFHTIVMYLNGDERVERMKDSRDQNR